MTAKIKFTCTQLNNIVQVTDGVSDKLYVIYTPSKDITFISLNNVVLSRASMRTLGTNNSTIVGTVDHVQFKHKVASIPPSCKNITLKILPSVIQVEYTVKHCTGSFEVGFYQHVVPAESDYNYQFKAPIPRYTTQWLEALHTIYNIQDCFVNLYLMSDEWRIVADNSDCHEHPYPDCIFEQTYKLWKPCKKHIYDNLVICLRVSKSLLLSALQHIPGKRYLQSEEHGPCSVSSNYKGVEYEILIRPLCLDTDIKTLNNH